MKTIKTLIMLKTEFSNMWEGPKPASLTYEADYKGNDTGYVENFEKNLVDEVCTQCDFWDCVLGYKESFSIQVKVLGDQEENKKYEDHLTKLITDEIVKRAGRSPESSFEDDMSDEKKREIERGVLEAKIRFPRLFIK